MTTKETSAQVLSVISVHAKSASEEAVNGMMAMEENRNIHFMQVTVLYLFTNPW